MPQAIHSAQKHTIFEESHLPMHLWLQAIHLMVQQEEHQQPPATPRSGHHVQVRLGITYKSAWFLTHRIRECMRDGALAPLGNNGSTVEVDETFIGQNPEKPKKKGARGYAHKNAMLTLVDRDTKQSKSIVVDDVTKVTLLPILRENIAREAVIYTDKAKQYAKLADEFAGHDFTTHSKGEYVKREKQQVHTNTVEGFYSIFKRGMKGVYQHCGKQHLHRYAAELDFRYNNRTANGVDDIERSQIALRSVVGKRLTYVRADIEA